MNAVAFLRKQGNRGSDDIDLKTLCKFGAESTPVMHVIGSSEIRFLSSGKEIALLWNPKVNRLEESIISPFQELLFSSVLYADRCVPDPFKCSCSSCTDLRVHVVARLTISK
jgi:hypothetical protein